MAKLLALFLLLLTLASMVSSEVTHEGVLQEKLIKKIQKSRYGPGSLRSSQCPGECTRRCAETQYHKPCMFFCQKCCRKCLCVPPGYYGNKQVCSCYNNWKTKRGGPKCP
ncbi:gibberellin-regulated protein 6-like [Typha latifolia]|uniref:gibberellin-regulated protein 6-like n=1 Tax=Typha latifolia TaxID=4733 RepID=UPI003C2C31C7